MRKTTWLMALALASNGACRKTESEKAAYKTDVEDNLKVLEKDLDKALDTKRKPELTPPM